MKPYLFLIVFLISSSALAAPGVGTYVLHDLAAGKKLSWTLSSVKKPTIVFFWTSRCTYCKEALRSLNDSIISYYDIVSVSCDDDRALALKAGDKEFSTWKPLFWLEKSANGDNFVKQYPTLMIVLPGGKVDTVYEGSQSDKMSYFIGRLKYLMNQGT